MKFIKYICAASLLAAAACALWSCSDEDDRRLSDAVLASTASLTFEAQDGAEKIITVYADADWVTEIPDWVTVTPAQGTGVTDVTITVDANLRDGAVDTPRKATLVFKGRTLASRAEVLIAQNGDKYRDVKECAVSELPALADETVVSVPAAVVVAVTTKGFVVSDERMTDNVLRGRCREGGRGRQGLDQRHQVERRAEAPHGDRLRPGEGAVVGRCGGLSDSD